MDKVDLSDKLDELGYLIANLLEDYPFTTNATNQLLTKKNPQHEQDQNTKLSPRPLGLCIPTPVHYVTGISTTGKYR